MINAICQAFISSLGLKTLITILLKYFKNPAAVTNEQFLINHDQFTREYVVVNANNEEGPNSNSAHTVTLYQKDNKRFYCKQVACDVWRQYMTGTNEAVRELAGSIILKNLHSINELIIVPEIILVGSEDNIAYILSESVTQNNQVSTSLDSILSGLEGRGMPEGFESFTIDNLKALQDSLLAIHATDYCIGNVDRHNQNIIIVKTEENLYKIGLIDQGLSFHYMKSLSLKLHNNVAKTFGKKATFNLSHKRHSDFARIESVLGVDNLNQTYIEKLQEVQREIKNRKNELSTALNQVMSDHNTNYSIQNAISSNLS